MAKLLLIIRGAPGAGKSTIAQALMAYDLFDRHYEADMYHVKEDGTYDWKPENLAAAHNWCQEQVEQAMKEDKRVIVSNTFVRHQDTVPYLQLADKYGYLVQEMILWETPFTNTHGVPEQVVAQKKKTLHDQFS